MKAIELYRIEEKGDQITVWFDHEHDNKDDRCPCVGLRFTKGDPLQRYTSVLVLTDLGQFYLNQNGIEWLNDLCNALTDYAATLYPFEFKPLLG